MKWEESSGFIPEAGEVTYDYFHYFLCCARAANIARRHGVPSTRAHVPTAVGRYIRTCYRVLIHARFDGPQFDVVDAHHVLEIAVARQPRDDGRRGRHLTGLDVRRPQRQLLLLADDHRARSVPGRPPVGRHRPYADPVRLQTTPDGHKVRQC